mgnify:FL=1
MLDIPLKRRKPTTFFVNSMSDLFHESLPIPAIKSVFDVMYQTPRHRYIILTKRADNMRQILRAAAWWAGTVREARSHIILGVSCENRATLDRLDCLRETPAACRMGSFEPLLEDLGPVDLTGISWCVIGGESGPGARPCRLEWIRSIVAQCREAKVPAFVKQLGANVGGDWPEFPGWDMERNRYPIRDRKGGDLSEFPADLRVRERPAVLR